MIVHEIISFEFLDVSSVPQELPTAALFDPNLADDDEEDYEAGEDGEEDGDHEVEEDEEEEA